jgi:hypothetical protein
MKSHLVLKNSTHRNSADEKNIRKVKDMNSKNCMHEITESAKTARVAWKVLKDLIDGKFYSEDPDKRRRFETAIESVETGTSRLVRILEEHNKGKADEKRLMQEVSIEAGLIALEFNVIKRASKSAPPESSKEEAQAMLKSRTIVNDCLFYISVVSIVQSQ